MHTLESLRGLLDHAVRDVSSALAELREERVTEVARHTATSLLAVYETFREVAADLPGPPASLEELAHALEHRAHGTVLRDVLRLYHEAPPFPSLDEVQARVRGQLPDHTTPPDEVRALDALLTLVVNPDLPDEQADELSTQAKAHIPSAVVTAAMRRRLRLGAAVPDGPPDTSPSDDPRTDVPAQEGESGPVAAPSVPPPDHAGTMNNSAAALPTGADGETDLPPQAAVEDQASLPASGDSPGTAGSGLATEETSPPPAEGPSVLSVPKEAGLPPELKGRIQLDLEAMKAWTRGKGRPDQVTEELGRQPGTPAGATTPPSEDQVSPPTDHEERDLKAAEPDPSSTTGPNPAEASPAPELPADHLWHLLEQGELSLVFHALEALGGQEPPATAVHLALLGQATDLSAPEFTALFERLVTEQASVGDLTPAGANLLFAGVLKPALFSVETAASAAALIRRLPLDECPAALAEAVVRLVDQLHGHDVGAALSGARHVVAWQARAAQAREDLEAYRDEAMQRTVKFVKGTELWKWAWRDQGLLGDAFRRALDRDGTTFEAPRMDEAEVNTYIQTAYQKELGGDRNGIYAEGRSQLIRFFLEALERLRQWEALQRERPDPGDYQTQQVVRFLEAWRSLRPDLHTYAARQGDTAARASATVLSRALEEVEARLAGRVTDDGAPLGETVGLALLRAGLRADEHGRPVGGREEYAAAVHALLGERRSWRDAFEMYLERADFRGARRVLRHLSGAERDELEQRWQDEAVRHRETLRRHRQRTQSAFDRATFQGLIPDARARQYEQHLEDLGRQVELLDTDYGQVRGALDTLERDLAAAYERRVDDLKGRMAALNDAPEARRRIQLKLDAGDIQSAQEFLEYALRGEPLPDEAGARDPFADFFPRTHDDIERYLANTDRRQVLQHLQRRDSRFVPDVTGLPGGQVRTALELLEAWYEAKQGGEARFGAAHVNRILAGLGFRVKREPSPVPGSSPRAWEVHVQSSADRREIPAAHYGSLSRGSYRVLPIWERPSEEELLQFVGQHDQATLILYFGRLSRQRRRDLARQCRMQTRTVVVVDELLLTFVAAERGSRLPVLFRCALPFTTFEPYTFTAGNVAPEMFYGREHEQLEIVSPSGSSFIYGGRQLGKSALLRHVERIHHRPRQGRIVRWLDLRNHQIGHGRPTDDLWKLLTRVLQEEGVLSGRSATTKPDRFAEEVRTWLDEDGERRIVLLLDEADQFLLQDGEVGDRGVAHYPHTSRLKNLMELTDRRFKVVFAGLHNVVKAVRDPNNPLKHFGRPIEIGPMLDRRERQAAQALVHEPFALLGYRFDPPDLPTRILARTNYYPSLIQIYAHHLLKHLSDRAGGPPYTVTSEHVDEVYQNRELRADIRERFVWTLQLDQRYEAAAYALAYEAALGNVDLERGVPHGRLYELAANWHPEAFRGTKRETMRDLAEEMEGLGILRLTREGTFTFRNQNVVQMLGTQTELEEALLDLQGRHELTAQLGDASYREPHPHHPDWANPLDGRQTFAVCLEQHGCVVVGGSAAMNLPRLPDFLRQAAGGADVRTVPANLDLAGFQRYLDRETEQRREEGFSLHVVEAGGAWGPPWVAAAEAKLRRLRSERHPVRVVFVADAAKLRQFGDELPALHRMRPWNRYEVAAWLEARHQPNTPQTLARIEQLTGNWPSLLEPLFAGLTARQSLTALLEGAEGRLAEPDWRAARLHDAGVSGLFRAVLEDLHALEGTEDAAQLADVSGRFDAGHAAATLSAGQHLGWIERREGRYYVTPFVARLLGA